MKEHQQHPRLEVASKDGRHSIAVGGFFQARYAATFTRDELASSRFGVPRTRLYVDGRLFSPKIRYRLMLGTAPFATRVDLYDAYVEWWARGAGEPSPEPASLPVVAARAVWNTQRRSIEGEVDRTRSPLASRSARPATPRSSRSSAGRASTNCSAQASSRCACGASTRPWRSPRLVAGAGGLAPCCCKRCSYQHAVREVTAVIDSSER